MGRKGEREEGLMLRRGNEGREEGREGGIGRGGARGRDGGEREGGSPP